MLNVSKFKAELWYFTYAELVAFVSWDATCGVSEIIFFIFWRDLIFGWKESTLTYKLSL
jgi:hypothetical protein